MYQHPEWLWYLIGVVVIGTVYCTGAMDRGTGEHAWSEGAALRASAGDAATVTRHAWRPDVDGDTIRVGVLLQRIADERRPGRHALIEDPLAVDEAPAVDEVPGDDEPTQPLYTHPYPLLKLAS